MFRNLALAALFLPLAAMPLAASASDSKDGIRLESAWSRASAGAARNGAAYLTVHNEGDKADRLVSGSSPVAETVELHTHIKDGEVMRMRPVEAIEVPTGGSVTLKPGGDHVMLIGLRAPLKEGETFPLTLVFENGGARDVEVTVKSVGARGDHSHGSHHKH